MKQILIIYNSGAGSTKVIVDIYRILLDGYQIEALPVSQSFDFSILRKYDLIIFAFPCYHCNISPLMRDFIERMPRQKEKRKAFVFITYGLYAGNTLRVFIKKCIEKNIYIEDYADYRAPATDGSLVFPSLKFMYRYENRIAQNIKADMRKIKSILSIGDHKYRLPYFKPYVLLNYPNAWLGARVKLQIKVRKDVCIHCNLCVENCPRGCWSIDNLYPVFDKSKCDACYKCIHKCPSESLIFSSRTIRKKKMNNSFYKEWKSRILSQIEIVNSN